MRSILRTFQLCLGLGLKLKTIHRILEWLRHNGENHNLNSIQEKGKKWENMKANMEQRCAT